MILYASLYFMTKNFWLFLGVSVFTRVFEGTVRSVYDVTGFTYLNIIWKSGFAQRFSTMEATNSYDFIKLFKKFRIDIWSCFWNSRELYFWILGTLIGTSSAFRIMCSNSIFLYTE